MMVRAVLDCGLGKAVAARQFNTAPKTVANWVERFRVDGVDGQRDRLVQCRFHRRGQTAPGRMRGGRVHCGDGAARPKQIAAEVGVSPAATVSRILEAVRPQQALSALEPAEPIRRYERDHPGELIHLDIKKLRRIGSVGHRITGRSAGVVNHHHGIGWGIRPRLH